MWGWWWRTAGWPRDCYSRSPAWRASRITSGRCRTRGLGSEELEVRIRDILDERGAGREAYLLSDMDGGSCGQACRRLLASGRVQGVFFGVNLPLLVEFVFLQGEPFERFVTLAVDKARTALGVHR